MSLSLPFLAPAPASAPAPAPAKAPATAAGRRASRLAEEWPTWCLIVLIHSGILGLTAFGAGLPAWAFRLLRTAHDTLAGRLLLGPVFALLFLNNNLHHLHHRHPFLPWWRIPALWAQERGKVASDSRLGGYGPLFRRAFVPARLLWPAPCLVARHLRGDAAEKE